MSHQIKDIESYFKEQMILSHLKGATEQIANIKNVITAIPDDTEITKESLVTLLSEYENVFKQGTEEVRRDFKNQPPPIN